jgi:hypothetical protein
MAVGTRNKGGTYLLAELNGAVLQNKAECFELYQWEPEQAVVFIWQTLEMWKTNQLWTTILKGCLSHD